MPASRRARHGRGADHPHNRARATFITVDDVLQPASAPPEPHPAAIQGLPPAPGADTEAVLLAWGFGETEVAVLRRRARSSKLTGSNRHPAHRLP